MTPQQTASILLALSDDPDLRDELHSQGYLAQSRLEQAASCRNTIDGRALRKLLKRTGWTQQQYRWIPPKDHPLWAVDNDESHPLVLAMVARSKIPPKDHAEAVQWIMSRGRNWDYTRRSIAHLIHRFKRENPSEYDTELLADIKLVLTDTAEYYITPTALAAGIMRPPSAQLYRDIARLMPWRKKRIEVNGKSFKAYVRPTTSTELVKAPRLDGLAAYLEGRLAVLEADVLRDVGGIPVRKQTPSDRAYLRSMMSGWKRQRSLHTEGWVYTRDLT